MVCVCACSSTWMMKICSPLMIEIETREGIAALIEGPQGKWVLTGPFAGMRYETEAVHSMHVPKLLGTYERELHPDCQGISR